jgi:hypothetical protein
MFNFKRAVIITLVVLGVASLAGCGGKQENYKVTKSGLELQSVQKQEFETTYNTAFASTMSVFQDRGYVIQTADKETGFITAASHKTEGFAFFVGQTVDYLKATAFIENMPSGMVSVRLNFVNNQETSSGYGMQGGNSVPVEDPVFYQGVFEKIKKAIFVRTGAR